MIHQMVRQVVQEAVQEILAELLAARLLQQVKVLPVVTTRQTMETQRLAVAVQVVLDKMVTHKALIVEMAA
jgi:hypothetical protein